MTQPTAVPERQQARYPVRISCEIAHGDEILFAETKNVSRGGAGIRCKQPLGVGELITIHLFLTQDGIEDPHRPAFECAASVRWCNEDGSQHLVGLQFVTPSSEQMAVLADFLKRVH